MNNVDANEFKDFNSFSQQNIEQMNDQKSESEKRQEFIARVLYSETSTVATVDEILAISCVIQNRIHKRDFGGSKSAYDVVKQPGAFSCVNSSINKNWIEFTPDLNNRTKLDMKIAHILNTPNLKLKGLSWTDDVVYYHDKSISMPRSWSNRYYKPILVKETQHFKFYKVIKRS